MDQLIEMLFQNQRFSILAMKTAEGSEQYICDSYAFAWYEGVYPAFHESADWHKPYPDQFKISEGMMEELSKLLDDHWIGKKPITFYDLESHYGIHGTCHPGEIWDRASLIDACRYMYLNQLFDDSFWSTLCENGQCPSEAHSICRQFRPDEIYFQ